MVSKVYVIRDLTAGADVNSFLADHDGGAKSYFINYCFVMKRTDFELSSVAEFDFIDDRIQPVSVERVRVCSCPDDLLAGLEDENV